MKDNDEEYVSGGNNIGNSDESAFRKAFRNMSNLINKSFTSDADKVSNEITKEIDKRMNQNRKATGYSTAGSIYSDLNKTDFKSKINPLINEFYGSDGLKDILHRKTEVDEVCKYMPILGTTINLAKINILRADNVEKNFLKVASDKITDSDKLAEIERNVKHLIKKYGLVEKFTNIYDEVAKYGETFIHVLPNEKLFNTKNGRLTTLMESMRFDELQNTEKLKPEQFNKYKKVELVFNEYDATLESQLLANITNLPIYESIQTESAKDGTESNLHGSIIRELKQENILPVYIDNTCLGYFYIEGNKSSNLSTNILIQKMTQRKEVNNGFNKGGGENKNAKIVKAMAEELGKKLSHKFFKDNLDVSGDIYNIIKFLDIEELKSIHVTYIPPNHCEHIWFKQNRDSKRGVGDIDERAIRAAKAYITLDICYLYASLTASPDTRAYYVQVDPQGNISPSQMLNNTLDNIKRSNRSLDSLLDIGNLSDTVKGLFHSVIIPVNQDSTPAIQPETYPGQKVDIDLDYLDSLEVKAVEALGGVPYEYVKSSFETDFSRRLSQDHGKFIQFCEERQNRLSMHFTNILNSLYKNEWNEDVSLIVTLPQPLTFKEQTSTNLLNIVTERANLLTEIFVPTSEASPDDEKKRLFKKSVIEKVLADYLDIDVINKSLEEVNIDQVSGAIMNTLKEKDSEE